MDADLVIEIERLAKVCREEGLQTFRIECWESLVAPPGTKSRSP
jgi:hypothetical protein